MKDTLLMYARYTRRANDSVLGLLDGLSVEERNVDRKSYYKSLSGLMSHVLGGTPYFHSLFRTALPGKAMALEATAGLSLPEGERLSGAEWEELKRAGRIADQATIDFVSSLSEADCSCPVPLDWDGGKPAAVPLHFLLEQLYTHGIHHRGQVSQILDSMGVDHDFSGLDVEFLPR